MTECDERYIPVVPLLGSTQKPFPDTGGAFVLQIETTVERFLDMFGVLSDGAELLGLCPLGVHNVDLLKSLDREMSKIGLSGDVPLLEMDITSDTGGFAIIDFMAQGVRKARLVYLRDVNQLWVEMWDGDVLMSQPFKLSGDGFGFNGEPPGGKILINPTSPLEDRVNALINGLAQRGIVKIDIPGP
jgi:hypothetical protein